MKGKLKLLGVTAIPLEEVAPLLQHGRRITFQCACEEFTIESACCVPEYN